MYCHKTWQANFATCYAISSTWHVDATWHVKNIPCHVEPRHDMYAWCNMPWNLASSHAIDTSSHACHCETCHARCTLYMACKNYAMPCWTMTWDACVVKHAMQFGHHPMHVIARHGMHDSLALSGCTWHVKNMPCHAQAEPWHVTWVVCIMV